jgi:hypothetical protein
MSDIDQITVERILDKKVDFFIDDFPPLKHLVKTEAGYTISLATGELIDIDLEKGTDWTQTFEGQPASSRMWLLSLYALGQLLASHKQSGDPELLRAAVNSLQSYFAYVEEAEVRESLGKIPSADHAAATRIKVLVKFLQVAGNQDPELIVKIIQEVMYWRDWIADPSHYSMCNHGLMGDVALLHAGVQFDAVNGRSTIDFALDRIVRLAEATFDTDGWCNENTVGYHRYNLHLYKNIIRFVDHYGLQHGEVLAKLRGITELAELVLRQVIWQNNTVPPIGDSPVYKVEQESINTSKCYFETGFCVVKNDDLYLSFVCGSRTETHKQVDDTSITLRYKGVEILTDAGSYLYNRSNPHRRCVESSYGHSGIFPAEGDGLLRRDFRGMFGPVSGKIDAFDQQDGHTSIRGTFNLAGGALCIERSIFLSASDELAIVDLVVLKEVAKYKKDLFVQRFLLGPELECRRLEEHVFEMNVNDSTFTVFQLADIDSSSLYKGEEGNKVRGWQSHATGVINPTFGIDFYQRLRGGKAAFSTVISLSGAAAYEQCSDAVRKFVADTIGR